MTLSKIILVRPYSIPTWAVNGRIDATKINAMNVPDLVPGVTHLWRFGRGVLSLADLLQPNNVLKPNPAWETSSEPSFFPSFTDGSVVTSSGNHHGLLTPLNQITTQTFVILVKYRATGGNIYVFGNATATTSDGGWALLQKPVTFTGFELMHRISGGTTGTTNIAISPSIPDGTWMALAIVQTATGMTVYIHNVTAPGGISITGAPLISSIAFSVGEIAYATGYSPLQEFNAFAYADSSLSEPTVDQIFANEIAQAASVGITIY